MSDLVERLRSTRADMLGTDDEEHYCDCWDAAKEIERLREEMECVEQTLLMNRKHITKLQAVVDAARRLCPEVDGKPAYLTNDYHWPAEEALRKALAELENNDG